VSDQVQTGDPCKHGIRGRCAVCECEQLSELSEEMLSTLKVLGQRMGDLVAWVEERLEAERDFVTPNEGRLRLLEEFLEKLREFPPTPACELRVVFDGPPGNESGRFVECENDLGHGVDAGEWRERDGLWELVITELPARHVRIA
jgi:hypothetical protein